MPNPDHERRAAEQRMMLRRHRPRAVTSAAEKPRVSCVIWGISECEARLAVAHPLATSPRHFTLNLFKDGSAPRDCEVARTDSQFVGVKFTNLVPQLVPNLGRRPS
jgi:hypothetical protein